MRLRTVAALGLGLAATACPVAEPGWSYICPDAVTIHGKRVEFELRSLLDLQARVDADQFAGTLHVEVELMNKGGEVVVLNMLSLTVQNAVGRKLMQYTVLETQSCEGELTGNKCKLAAGQTGRLAAAYRVPPLAPGIRGFFGRPNPELKMLTVSLDPRATRGNVELDVSCKMLLKD